MRRCHVEVVDVVAAEIVVLVGFGLGYDLEGKLEALLRIVVPWTQAHLVEAIARRAGVEKRGAMEDTEIHGRRASETETPTFS
jgi:hypothetical protein